MKVDSQGRITILKEIRPNADFGSTPLAVFYSPKENALGFVPWSKRTDEIRVMGMIRPDSQARIVITKFLPVVHAEKGDDLMVYVFKGTIFIRKP